MRTFSEGKRSRHRYWTFTRNLNAQPTKNHARPYKVGPVGDVRGEASVERCDRELESWQTFRERR